ncbi:MAG: hypothetical protein COB66_00725 [Coxiella sp. (in: Bacteria)]|nr:MAG: hypothetical protein COB66_00725 [Coxiella sp. (in: g-proteobacteria)]
MRLVGTFENKRLAQRFSNYLKGQAMDNQIRQDDHGIAVWVLDDHYVDQAKQLLSQFNENPNDASYEVRFKDQVREERAERRKLKQHYRQYFQRPSGNQITLLLIVICVAIYFLSLSSVRNAVFVRLIISVPGYAASSVWAQQPWRLVTPMFLHFGILHLIFNMFWLYDFGTLIEKKEGKVFYIIFILLASLGSGLLQFVIKGPMFGGMSGVVYALFAYIWISAKYNLRSGYYMANNIVIVLLGWFILCFTGFIGNVANYGHLGGLLVGVVFAFAKKAIQDARKR